MKKIGKLALAGLLAIAVAGMTFTVKAEDKPATEKKETAKRDTVPFHGKVSAVDKSAHTITLGARTFHTTPTTRFTKDGKPATLDDVKVGEEVGGLSKKTDDKLNLVSLRIGPKPEKSTDGEKPKSKKE